MSSRHKAFGPRLGLAALAFLVVVVAGLGVWQVLAARSSQQSEIEAGETNTADLAGSALAGAIDNRLGLLTNLASQPALASIFSSSPVQEAKVADALHELYSGFASFDLVGPTGQPQARWPAAPVQLGQPSSLRRFFSNVIATGKAGVSGAVHESGPPADVVTVLAAPVHNRAGKVAGVLAASLPGSSLSSLIGGSKLQAGGSVLIFDQDGAPLSAPGPGRSASYQGLAAVARALAGGTGSATGELPGLKGPRLMGYAPVPALGWAVVVEEPAAALDGQITALTERLAGIEAVVLVAAAGCTALMASLVKRLARERQRAGSVLASVGEGVATFDPSGTVQQANPALEQLTGCSSQELVGRSWSEALHLYDNDGQRIDWASSMASRAAKLRAVVATSGYEVHLARPNGQRVPVSVTAAPLASGDELLGSVVVIRDVSPEREIDQMKSTLVSTVSHELRTPLTMVQGFSELLLTRDDLGEQRSRAALQQVHGAAQRLGRLIDDLLSVSRIDSGKVMLDLAEVDVRAVVDEVVQVVGNQAKTPQSGETHGPPRLLVEVEPSLPAVWADRDKLVQIVTNLLSNALKYSAPQMPVAVHAHVNGGVVEVSVKDRGIGLSEAECSQVFEKFKRIDRPEVRKVSGTGLGLYITKSLVEMQHGKIWVDSVIGEGTVFTFSVPCAPGDGAHEMVGANGSREAL